MKNMNVRSDPSNRSHTAGPKETKPAKLKLTMQHASDTKALPPRPLFRKWVKAALRRDAEVVLRIVDEAEGRNLNREFRHKDYATNVLTFVYSEARPNGQPGAATESHPLTGDIVLCAPVIESEAGQQQKSVTAHYAHLTVHGVLHLQGYDHERDTEAAEMERLEAEILGRLGFDDPYTGH